jgi:hypothetical protein
MELVVGVGEVKIVGDKPIRPIGKDPPPKSYFQDLAKTLESNSRLLTPIYRSR